MSLFCKPFVIAMLLGPALCLSACGSGGGGRAPLPVAQPAPAPTPTPTPTNFDTAEYRNQSALDRVNALAAYEAGAHGAGVIVSVIDTGIDDDHPEFAGRIHPQSADLLIAGVVAPDEVRAGGPDIEDYDDHGTPVASIIGAARNGAGIHGVAPQATLLIFRVDDDGSDENSLLGNAIYEAVTRSADLGAGVVNMSFGTDEPAARSEFAADISFLKDNDIVTVLAAGNDSDADPDQSALGALDVPGDPAAIIAGSVDSSNVISSFSDRAGVAADVYLVAPGEFLRGVVPNGGASQTRSFSGTSASTPMITGAVALIRSRWPALSATEVVDILLTSATDLGAPGTDAIYGRGLLNIAAAMSPIGGVSTSSISGSEVDPESLGATLSGPYGSSLSELDDIVVLDGYDRDFRLSLKSLVAASGPETFDLEGRYNPFDDHRYSNIGLRDGWRAQMRLTARDQSASSLLNNQAAFNGLAGRRNDFADYSIGLALAGRISDDMHLFAAQGFAPAAIDRMSNPAQATPFLSEHAFADAYLPRASDSVTAKTAYRLSNRITADFLFASGGDRDLAAETLIAAQGVAPDQPQVMVARAGVTLTLGDARLRLEQGLRQEQGGVFNARFAAASASTIYSAVEGAWSPSAMWRLQARLAAGLTHADEFGFNAFATQAPVLKTTQFSVALRRASLFGAEDSLWLGVTQPLQIEAGALNLILPTGFDQHTQSLVFSPVSASLAPDGRRLDFEAGYRLYSDGAGVIDLNLIHQTFSGFGLDAQTTALLRGRFDF